MSMVSVGGLIERFMAKDATVCMACHVSDLCILGDLLCIDIYV